MQYFPKTIELSHRVSSPHTPHTQFGYTTQYRRRACDFMIYPVSDFNARLHLPFYAHDMGLPVRVLCSEISGVGPARPPLAGV